MRLGEVASHMTCDAGDVDDARVLAQFDRHELVAVPGARLLRIVHPVGGDQNPARPAPGLAGDVHGRGGAVDVDAPQRRHLAGGKLDHLDFAGVVVGDAALLASVRYSGVTAV